MVEMPKGEVDPRTGRAVSDYANWTQHPNNPSVRAAE
jgi:dihydropyrimidine dehydrogenase (NAD+) subunit PreA